MEQENFESKIKEKLLEIDRMISEYSPDTDAWSAFLSNGAIVGYNDANYMDDGKISNTHRPFDVFIDLEEREC